MVVLSLLIARPHKANSDLAILARTRALLVSYTIGEPACVITIRTSFAAPPWTPAISRWWPYSAKRAEITYPVRAPQMHRHHLVPHLFVHTHERLIPQNTSIRHQDMHSAKGVQACLDNLLALLGGTDGSDCFPTGCTSVNVCQTFNVKIGEHTRFDLLDDPFGPLLRHIVHNDVRAQLGKHQSVRPAQTGTGARDDDCLALEFDGGGGLLGRLGTARFAEPAL